MWSLVANSSDARGDNVWNTPTKLHYIYHLGQKAVYVNPRKGNTMIEETYMGVCKSLAMSCLSSVISFLRFVKWSAGVAAAAAAEDDVVAAAAATDEADVT